MVNIIKAENEDPLKLTPEENRELNVNKTKKFVVTLPPVDKTPFVLPKRGEKKPFVPKFQLKRDNQKENTEISPISTTNRPQVMETKKFTTKPHAVDRTQELLGRYNFYNKRAPSKFNRFGTEENLNDADKNDHKGKVVKNSEVRQNVTNLDVSSENNEEIKETRKPTPRRFMKASASHKVKVVTSPPVTSTTTQKNYKIKDLLRNHKYNPMVERRKMPVLVLENDDAQNNNTRKNRVVAAVDHKKSAFIRRKASTTNPEEDEIETTVATDDSKSRQER